MTKTSKKTTAKRRSATHVKGKGTKNKKKMNMTAFRTSVKKSHAHHKNWKTKITEAINNGEHNAAEAAIKMLHKSKAAIHKLVSQLEGHSAKKRS